MKETVLTWFRHNKEYVYAALVLIIIAVFAISCESTGTSIINLGQKVNAQQLELEFSNEMSGLQIKVDSLQKKYKLSKAEIEKADALKADILALTTETASAVQAGAALDPLGIVLRLAAIFGVGGIALATRRGSVIDLKDKEIATLKVESAAPA